MLIGCRPDELTASLYFTELGRKARLAPPPPLLVGGTYTYYSDVVVIKELCCLWRKETKTVEKTKFCSLVDGAAILRPTINLSEPEINTHVGFISDKNMPFESLPRVPVLMICPSVSSSPRRLLRHHLIYALRTDQSVQVSQFNIWTSDFGLSSSFNWLHISDCWLCKTEFSQFRSGERGGDPFLCISVQSTPTRLAFSPPSLVHRSCCCCMSILPQQPLLQHSCLLRPL